MLRSEMVFKKSCYLRAILKRQILNENTDVSK